MTSSDDHPTLKRVVTNRSATNSRAAAGKDLATVLLFPVPRSDAGIVQGLRASRMDAVDGLCERYGADLLRVAMRVLGPGEALVGVVSDAVSAAVSAISRLEEPSALRSWLLSQLMRVITGRLSLERRRRRWAWLTGASWSRRLSDCGSSAQKRTYRLLNRLSANERIVLCLARLEGMEPTEIATILGTSVAEVRARLERAELMFERMSARE